MGWRQWFGAATLAAMVGCAQDSSRVARQEHEGVQDEGLVLVRVIVLQRDAAGGNPLWTPTFTTEVLRQADRLTQGALAFSLVSYDVHPSDEWYGLPQGMVLHRALALWKQPGMLTVVISAPDASDSAGVSTIDYAVAPLIVMRSRDTEWGAMTTTRTAEILLHELGHQMSLRHHGQGAIGLPWTTDDWYLDASGLAYAETWAAYVLGSD